MVQRLDHVRVIGEHSGSINEWALVLSVCKDSNTAWVSNINMPYQGTISRVVPLYNFTRMDDGELYVYIPRGP